MLKIWDENQVFWALTHPIEAHQAWNVIAAAAALLLGASIGLLGSPSTNLLVIQYDSPPLRVLDPQKGQLNSNFQKNGWVSRQFFSWLKKKY